MAVAVRLERRIAVRVARTLLSGIDYETGAQFAAHTTHETGFRIDPQVPVGAAFRTTSRTVPGTVPKAIPETSFSARLAAQLQAPKLFRSVSGENAKRPYLGAGFRAGKAANPGGQD